MKKNLLLLVISIFFISYLNMSAQDFWKRLNGPYGANISKIVIDSKENIYAGTKTDGVFKSTDKGLHWSSYNNDQMMPEKTNIVDLAINNSDVLYAIKDTGIVYRRTFSGNWTSKLISGLPKNNCIYVNPKNNDVLIGTKGTTSQIIKYNEDISTSFPKTISLVTEVFSMISTNTNVLLIGTDKGIYKSTDDGDNWSKLNPPIDEPVYCFAINADGKKILAGTKNGLLVSLNDGGTWSSQAITGNSTKVISLAYHKNDYFIAGTETHGLFFSSPSLGSWTAYNTGLEANKVQAVATNSNGDLFCGTFFSFYYSPNTTANWEPRIKGLGIQTINSFAMLAKRGEVLAATNLGVYRTIDNGETWEQLNRGLGTNLIISALVITKDSKLIAGTQGNGLFKSTNFGQNWEKLVSAGFTAVNVNTLDTNKYQDLFAGTDKGVYRSQDNGITWNQMSSQTGQAYPISSQNILSFTSNNDDYIYAGTESQKIYRNRVQGNSWVQLTSGLTSVISVTSMAYDEINKILFAGTSMGVLASFTKGDGWASANGQLNQLQGQALAMTVGMNDSVYVGLKNKKGTYASGNQGVNWGKLIDSELDNYEIKALKVSGRGYIYAGAIGGGVYRSHHSTSRDILLIFGQHNKRVLFDDLHGDITDTIKAQQGEEIVIGYVVKNFGNQFKSDAQINVFYDSSLSKMNKLLSPTDVSGKTADTVKIPVNTYDGIYPVSLFASHITALDSEPHIINLDIERPKLQKMQLMVQPLDTIIFWKGLDVKFTATVNDTISNPIEGASVTFTNSADAQPDYVVDSDINGNAEYSFNLQNDIPEADYIIRVSASKNGFSISDTVTRIIKFSLTDVDDIETADGIVIYPNPNDGEFVLEINSPLLQSMNYQIDDVLGRTVFAGNNNSFKYKQRENIDLKYLPAGIYFLRVSLENKVFVKIISIQ